jgi:hypothetical protein
MRLSEGLCFLFPFSVEAETGCSWIPGLAVLARNDGGDGLRHSSESWIPEGGEERGVLLLSSSVKMLLFFSVSISVSLCFLPTTLNPSTSRLVHDS